MPRRIWQWRAARNAKGHASERFQISMTIRIALFRGINVGGRNVLPMKNLRTILESLGCLDVKTYIQSGNVVFSHADTDDAILSRDISMRIEEEHGFSPQVLLLAASELRRAVAENPFADATSAAKELHLWFLAAAPQEPDLDGLQKVKVASESFVLAGRVFYLHAPEGIGRSKVAQRVEKLLGVPATARNWRTVTKILELAKN